jgi:hypothetical protein
LLDKAQPEHNQPDKNRKRTRSQQTSTARNYFCNTDDDKSTPTTKRITPAMRRIQQPFLYEQRTKILGANFFDFNGLFSADMLTVKHCH